MSVFVSAVWAELLKSRRSRVSWLSFAAFAIFPVVDGLFMFILQNPERARAMGIITVKAQMAAAVADWPTFFQVLLLGTAVGGTILFAFLTAWVFGREFSDHTAKELLALPTPREAIVGAKFFLTALWMLALSLVVFAMGLGVGAAVAIPGWSAALGWSSLATYLKIVLLTYMLTTVVALFASAGRGYLPPLGWAILTMAASQIAIVLGWGDWFPWAVPGILVSLGEEAPPPVEIHSYAVVFVVFLAGAAATFIWWRSADQTR